MRPLTLAAALALAAPATAQDLTDPGAVGDAAADLMGQGIDLAEEVLLIRDLLGREVLGPDGDSLGTVENFVLIPGGNLVAAIVTLPDGQRIALPYQAVSAGVTLNGPVQIPMTRAEIDASQELADLTDAMGL